MDRSIDQKMILHTVAREVLTDLAPDELTRLEASFGTIYESFEKQQDVTGASDGTSDINGIPLTAEQLVDASIIVTTLWIGKSLFWFIADPILEDRVLPDLDDLETKLSRTTGHPELVQSIRDLLERAIRKHLGKPKPPDR